MANMKKSTQKRGDRSLSAKSQRTKREAEKPNSVNLREVFLGLQSEMETSLSTSRKVIAHPGTKGEAGELRWLEMFNDYLPKRYCADKAFVIDHGGNISEQIDLVVFDRQYSPFLFNKNGAKFIPAESVYGVFEIKQEIDAHHVRYAGEKALSVRRLKRTSAPIHHAGGFYAKPKEPPRILAGILTLDSSWNPSFGAPLRGALAALKPEERLDIGCALKCGGFEVLYTKDGEAKIQASDGSTALIFFFLKFLARLQEMGTVPALDFGAYSSVL